MLILTTHCRFTDRIKYSLSKTKQVKRGKLSYLVFRSAIVFLSCASLRSSTATVWALRNSACKRYIITRSKT